MIKLKMYLLGLMLVLGGIEGSSAGATQAAFGTAKGLGGTGGGGFSSYAFNHEEAAIRKINTTVLGRCLTARADHGALMATGYFGSGDADKHYFKASTQVPTGLIDVQIKESDNYIEASIGQFVVSLRYFTMDHLLQLFPKNKITKKLHVFDDLLELKRVDAAQEIYVRLIPDRKLESTFDSKQTYKFNGLVTDQDLLTKLCSKKPVIWNKVEHAWICVNPVADEALVEQAGKSAWNCNNYAAVRWIDYKDEKDAKSKKYAILRQTLNRHATFKLSWATATWEIYELAQGTKVSLPLLRKLQQDNKILCVNLPGPDTPADQLFKAAHKKWTESVQALNGSNGMISLEDIKKNVIVAWKAREEMITCEQKALTEPLYFLEITAGGEPEAEG